MQPYCDDWPKTIEAIIVLDISNSILLLISAFTLRLAPISAYRRRKYMIDDGAKADGT
jgi:hypothetical protein